MSDWLDELQRHKESWERRETNSYQPYRRAVLDNADELVECARKAEELERENQQLREREREQRKQLNHIEAYCSDYVDDITTSHKMIRNICEVIGMEWEKRV